MNVSLVLNGVEVVLLVFVCYVLYCREKLVKELQQTVKTLGTLIASERERLEGRGDER